MSSPPAANGADALQHDVLMIERVSSGSDDEAAAPIIVHVGSLGAATTAELLGSGSQNRHRRIQHRGRRRHRNSARNSHHTAKRHHSHDGTVGTVGVFPVDASTATGAVITGAASRTGDREYSSDDDTDDAASYNDSSTDSSNHPLHPRPHHSNRPITAAGWFSTSVLMARLKQFVSGGGGHHQSRLSGKRMATILGITMLSLSFLYLLVHDLVLVNRDPSSSNPHQQRYFRPKQYTDALLAYVHHHPVAGVIVIILTLAATVPIGLPFAGPLCMGCGYIYVEAYGWHTGYIIAVLTGFVGTVLGGIACFFLGRYCCRMYVRSTIMTQHPLLEAVDIASKDNGFRIMAMLDFTPLPLGPLSYVCGTTSMAFSNFVLAKIFSLPRMMLATFIGASTSSLIATDAENGDASNDGEGTNKTFMVIGLVFAITSITASGRYIQIELNKVMDREHERRRGEEEDEDTTNINGDEENFVDEILIDTNYTDDESNIAVNGDNAAVVTGGATSSERRLPRNSDAAPSVAESAADGDETPRKRSSSAVVKDLDDFAQHEIV